MTVRGLKKRAQELHGHYEVHSYRQWGHQNPFGPMTRHEAFQNRRVRVGISRSGAWRTHV